jgi:hypothetical protein
MAAIRMQPLNRVTAEPDPSPTRGICATSANRYHQVKGDCDGGSRCRTLANPIELPVARPTVIEPVTGPRVSPTMGLGAWGVIISTIEQAVSYAIDGVKL